MKRLLLMALLVLSMGSLSACGDGQKKFYWERPNTGAVWFARDHNQCLRESDWWPYEMPGWPWGWGKPKDMNLRFDNNASNGIWAEFRPFPGAQPVYVNSVAKDWSMSADDYQECMEARDYRQRRPKTVESQVFHQ